MIKRFVLVFSSTCFLACGLTPDSDKPSPPKPQFFRPALPAYVSAFDLNDQVAACAKATEIATAVKVELSNCSLRGSELTLTANQLEKTFDLASANTNPMIESVDNVSDQKAKLFFLDFILSVGASKK